MLLSLDTVVKMIKCLIIIFAICIAVMLSGGYEKILWCLVMSFCFIGIYESFVSLLQLLNCRESRNNLFVLTGTFKNPGPLGCYLAMTVAVAGSAVHKLTDRLREPFFYFNNIFLWILLFAGTFCAMLLPASMSRGAIVALFVSGCVFLLKETKCSSWFRLHKMATAYIAIAFIALCVGLFFLKKDSAIGRLHIWNMECRAIVKHPLGTGQRTFEETYGLVQEEYFRSKNRPAAIVRVAGCPNHSFNEYLGIGVEFGVPVMLLAIGIVAGCIYVLLANRSPLAYGLIVLAVFAFFSYPLDVPLLAGSLAIFLGAGTAEILKKIKSKWPLVLSFVVLVISGYAFFFIHMPREKEREIAEATWHRAKYWADTKRYSLALEDFALAEDVLSGNQRFLYDYGYALYLAQNHKESINVLEKGAQISNDPMFHNIIGRNCESLGDVNRAEKEYWKAHYMVPCRLYPLQRLMQLYARQGRYEEADSIRKKALAMPVNVLNKNMVNIYMEILNNSNQ